MSNIFKIILFILLGILAQAKDYTNKQITQDFIDKMVTKHHFSRDYLYTLFSDVEFQGKALSIFLPHPNRTKRKKPKHGSWDIYERKLIGDTRARKGAEYIYKHRDLFRRIYRRYGVEPEYVASIIGIESYYGENRGKFPVFDTLSTLGFETNRRSKYFRYELEKFLLLSRSESFNPKNVKGSYAGAIGLGQFMPSTYKHFAVDFDGDGRKSMQTTSDAIASVANYLRKHGWKRGAPVATRVSYKGNRYTKRKTGYKHKYSRSSLTELKPKYGTWHYNGKVRLIKLDRKNYDELWYGAKNFYVITRYNHSSYYAMAVYQLAQKIKKEYKKLYGDLK